MFSFEIPDPVANVYILFQQTSEAVSRFTETYFLKAGITRTQFSVLVLLDQCEAPPTLTELGRWMFRSKNSMTTVIDHMERDGLVQRVRDPRDKRSVRVVATEAGRALFDRGKKPSEEIVYKTLSCFEKDELDRFAEFLRMMRENVLDHLAGELDTVNTNQETRIFIGRGWE
jgi:DNA-binding MarR family transcriptional regulator